MTVVFNTTRSGVVYTVLVKEDAAQLELGNPGGNKSRFPFSLFQPTEVAVKQHSRRGSILDQVGLLSIRRL